MNGRITLESELEQGSMFTLHLPLAAKTAIAFKCPNVLPYLVELFAHVSVVELVCNQIDVAANPIDFFEISATVHR